MRIQTSLCIPCLVIWLLTFQLFLEICPVQGQNSHQNKNLTMEESINRALMKNNQLLASKFEVKKARWEKMNAWTLLLPSLSLNARFMRIDDQTFAERDFRRYLPEPIRSEIPQTVLYESNQTFQLISSLPQPPYVVVGIFYFTFFLFLGMLTIGYLGSRKEKNT